jgi:hypothetical protein
MEERKKREAMKRPFADSVILSTPEQKLMVIGFFKDVKIST